MTVKNAILAAAELLGIADGVRAYLEGEDIAGEADTCALLRGFNAVESDLALSYLPLKTEETVESETGAIRFSELSRSALRVLRVFDKWGNEQAFKLFPEYLKTDCGRVKIEYAYAPEEKTLDGESDFVLFVSERLFAYGIAAQYALASGEFEDAAVWESKYKDELLSIYRAKPRKKISSRRWV